MHEFQRLSGHDIRRDGRVTHGKCFQFDRPGLRQKEIPAEGAGVNERGKP
jgi:hypothetical protein